MKINRVGCYDTNSNKSYKSHRYHTQIKTPNFKGIKGFAIGAVTGGVIASFFTHLYMIYAALGGMLGDWIEEKNKNDGNNNQNQDNYRNQRNARFYG